METWDVESIFSQQGVLGRLLGAFEERAGQKEMASHVFSALQEEGVAIVEAGTGTGKSMAYLAPSLYWAITHKERVVISTHTIALQEQLIHKDLPFLIEALDLDIEAVLVKGVSNYLCLRKLQEGSAPLDPTEEETLKAWSRTAKQGSRSDIPFPISPATWEGVCCDMDACSRKKCSHYKECFLFQARKTAEEAQILVVNHHLLLFDVQQRSESEKGEGFLPSYSRLVIDEAHHLESVAQQCCALELNRLGIHRILSRVLIQEKKEQTSIRAALGTLSAEEEYQLDMGIPTEKKECGLAAEVAFATLSSLLTDSTKKRLKQEWESPPLVAFAELSLQLTHLEQSLSSFSKRLDKIETAVSVKTELDAQILQLAKLCQKITLFFQVPLGENEVRWIERDRHTVRLCQVPLDLSSYLADNLFTPLRSVTLCSATLTTNQSFSFLKQRIGLGGPVKRPLFEQACPSPFPYEERSLLVVPDDLPSPLDPSFVEAIIPAIEQAIQSCGGSAFVLFTSYDMLVRCADRLKGKYPIFQQGDSPRHALLQQFKQTPGGVLLGTNSFWEGVDVPGEALRCVIITKLPFTVPTEPVHEAQSEALKRQGKSPFYDYAVPQAVIRFKQGFGRLIRKKDDRGCIVCLDNRLLTKGYGKLFLSSIPPSPIYSGPSAKVWAKMREFYQAVLP